MKARDIISDWPRGRSTTSFGHQYSSALIWGRISWTASDFHKLAEEVKANNKYHQKQKAMFDVYIEYPLRYSLRYQQYMGYYL